MQKIPVIYFKKNKIKTSQDSKEISLEDLVEKYSNQKQLYIFDYDGIEKNRPNLCSYPKLSKNFDIWVDSKPEELGDIVDYVLSGGYKIIIRKNQIEKNNIDHIKDITENEIYAGLNLSEIKNLDLEIPDLDKFDGFIIFNTKDEIEKDYHIREKFNKIVTNKDIYIYEPKGKYKVYWNGKKIKGLLVDLEYI